MIGGALALSLIMAYRRMSRRAATFLLYVVLLALMTPGILLGLGMILWWKLLGLSPSLYPAGLGVHVVWALPFGFLVMLSIFNRYDVAVEEAARDLGASVMQTFTRVTLPIVWGGVFGAALFAFTLSWNEFERTLLVSTTNTLPLEIYGELTSAALQPNLYALGVITTFGTILLVFLMLIAVALIVRRTARTQAAAFQTEEDLPENRQRCRPSRAFDSPLASMPNPRSKSTATKENALAADERDALLAVRQDARLGTNRGDGWWHVTPIWYVWEDGCFRHTLGAGVGICATCARPSRHGLRRPGPPTHGRPRGRRTGGRLGSGLPSYPPTRI